MVTHPTITPALFYKDPRAALVFLRDAFGFELDFMIEDEGGNLVHSQMMHGEGRVMVGMEWDEDHRSPLSVAGKNTQTTHVQLNEDVDAHCETARKAGAEIIVEPATQFYGDRTYRARDPEGHIWTSARTVEVLTPAEWDRKSGLKTTTSGKA